MAEIKPEPPEGLKPAETEEKVSQNSPQIGFGEILKGSDEPQEPVSESPPPPETKSETSGTSPHVSFRDLLKEEGENMTQKTDDLFEIKETPQPQVVEKIVEKEVIKEVPVVDEKKVEERLKSELDARRIKANATRQAKRENILSRIVEYAREKGRITSLILQDEFNLPQSTITDYLHDLVEKGLLKRFGQKRGTYYTI